MHGPVADIALGWCWLPIALVVHAVEPHLTTVQTIMGVIFLISFAHQPLTLGLVYGDPMQRDAHRRLYRWAPWVAFVLIVVGLNVSLSAVALMAGLWNAEHTLMQRYGVMRIYGRKAGDDHGRIEKPMLIIWLVAGIAYLGGYVDLQRMVHKLGFGGTNARSVGLLGDLARVARVSCSGSPALAGLVFVVRWWQAERRLGAAASRPKHWYALGTAGLRGRCDGRSDRRYRRVRRCPRHRVLRRRAQLPAQAQRCRAGRGGDAHAGVAGPRRTRSTSWRSVRSSTSPGRISTAGCMRSPCCSSAPCTSSTTGSCGSFAVRRWPHRWASRRVRHRQPAQEQVGQRIADARRGFAVVCR